MRRETLIILWVAGLGLAALIYAVGPDQFFDTVFNALDALDFGLRRIMLSLGTQIYGVIRALALALYLLFVVLALLASARGRRGVWALIVVTAVFAMLVWRPYSDFPVAPGRWIVAFALVLVAAIVMSQRLMQPPRDTRWPPFPPQPRPPQSGPLA